MFYRRFLLFLLLTCLYLKVFPAVFVVTSNADSGPGTLREALMSAAANGSAEKDYINFNLPGNTQADVTITLQTQLPDVTSNVIIDGTTQPGLPLGVSDAKIIITVAAPATNLNAFNISSLVGPTDTIQFFGLFIKGFSPQPFGGGSAISGNNPCNLVIGAPGKGNVMCGNYYAAIGQLRNTIIQSNFIGIDPDGETADPNWFMLYTGYDFSNLLIGGDSQADGNVFVGSYQNGINIGDGIETIGTEAVTIKNNYFGTDYKGIKTLNNSGFYIDAYVPALDLNVVDNIFSAGTTAIEVLGVGEVTLRVTGNFFGTDKTQTYPLGNSGQAIETNGFVTATIGGDGALQNVFTGYFNPILTPAIQSSTNVIKNSFYCNNFVELSPVRGNYIRVIKLFDNEVSGDAPPGATVQLYYSTSQCTTCNPNTWFATVTADANGVWDYKGDTRQNVMASSTVNNNTIGFEPYYVDPSQVTVVDKDCRHKGSLEIIEKRKGRFQFKWKDSDGNIIGTGQEVEDLEPGQYTLEINEGGNCPTATGTFYINDDTPHTLSQTFQLDCTNTTGYFYANVTTGATITLANYYWEDDKGNVISTEESIKDLPAGKYYLYITDSKGCTSEKALYEVLPAVGAPTIDDSNVKISGANCDLADGSITGITVSNIGSGSYGWALSDGTVVNYGQRDLKNAVAGQYYFFIDYSSNCPPVKSALFMINAVNGVTIDESNAQTKSASCSVDNGSVTGIAVTGATQYQWVDANNKIAGTNADLQNAAPGDYVLTASNNFCSKTSKTYHIGQQAPTQFPAYAYTMTPACFGKNNGAITVAADILVNSARWVNSQGQNAGGNSPAITDVPAGDYQLYLTDANGCESFYHTYTVPTTSQLQILPGSGQITNDQCGLKTGSIKGVQVTGGLTPYSWSWSDANNKVIASAVDVSGVGAGTYTLNVSDASGCSLATAQYAIQDENTVIPAPIINNLQLCAPGDALLQVGNPSAAYRYRLYDSENSTSPLDEQARGIFKINVKANTTFYVSQVSGECESSRSAVQVSVGLTAVNIANVFTPNGDGVNDYWKIKGIENYPNAVIQLFTRYGQKVFESKGYGNPFDGTANGTQLPVGVYYYIINLSTNCNLLSGSLTIIR